jgi:hypothetical protein
LAISLTHSFTNPKADGVDTTIVRPSDWNAEHVLEQATNKLLGRTTAGTGATEEIAVGTGLSLAAGTLSYSGGSASNDFEDVAALLADTSDYTDFSAGNILRTRAEGFAYEVAASGASDHDITNAGGLKLYAIEGVNGLDVRMFGAVVGVNTAPVRTANSAAFVAAHNCFTRLRGTLYGGGQINLPRGYIYLADTWEIAREVYIKGNGGQMSSSDASATVIAMPADTTAIRMHTPATAQAPFTGNASSHSSILEDFMVHCPTYSAGTPGGLGHGIWASARIIANRVSARNMGGCGWRIIANFDDGAGTEIGEANEFSLIDCAAVDCGQNGLYVAGNDVNASTIINFNSKNNVGWGIKERSKFQNTYITPHLNGNDQGQVSDRSDAGNVWIGGYFEIFTGNDGSEWSPRSMVFGGILPGIVSYPLINEITGDGSGATAACVVGGAGTVLAVLPTAFGSGYTTATLVFEHGDGSGAAATANIVGGQITSYTVTNAGSGYPPNGQAAGRFNNGDGGGLVWNGPLVGTGYGDGSSRVFNYEMLAEADSIVRIKTPGDGTYGMQFPSFYNSNKCYGIWNGLAPGGNTTWITTNLSTTFTGGRTSAVPTTSWFFENGFWLGAGADARNITTVEANAPTTGDYARGDIILRRNVVLGGLVGWVCTTTGSIASSAWQASTAYTVGALRTNDGGKTYLCTTAGTSAGSGGPTGTGSAISDGTCVWDYKAAYVLSPFGNSVLENTETYDPPSLAAGVVDTIGTITVTGAALGDIADVSFSLDLQGIDLKAWVSATNTVSYQFSCPAGGATVDLGSGTVKCRVRK